MKCFEVRVNGVKVCTAGVGDDGVLTGILSFAKRAGSSESLDLRIGGLANRAEGGSEQREWFNQNLAVGDEVTIKIVEAAEYDQPTRTETTLFDQCSFCNKRQADFEKLIAGPAVFICNKCIGDCLSALATGEPTGAITTIIDKTAEEAKCSFCGKDRTEVAGIVGVATARVCNECIKICDDILQETEES